MSVYKFAADQLAEIKKREVLNACVKISDVLKDPEGHLAEYEIVKRFFGDLILSDEEKQEIKKRIDEKYRNNSGIDAAVARMMGDGDGDELAAVQRMLNR